MNNTRNGVREERYEINPRLFSVPELMLELNRKNGKTALEKKIGFQIAISEEVPTFLEGIGNEIFELLDRQLCYFLLGTLRGTVRMSVNYLEGNLEVSFSVKGYGIWDAGDAHAVYLQKCNNEVYVMGGTCSQKASRGEGLEIDLALPLTVPAEIPAISQGEAMTQRWLLADIEMSDLVEEVLKTVPDRMAGLKADVSSKNLGSLRERVHGFKGIAGNFRMDELYKVLVDLDCYLRGLSPSDLGDVQILSPLDEIVSAIPERLLGLVFENGTVNEETRAIRILVADDAEENRILIRRVLMKLPVYITEATNGEEALAFLEEGMYDALLLDMQMPVLDGVGVLNAMAKNGKPPGLSIYAMSAEQGPEDWMNHIFLGCDGSFPKPVDKYSLCFEMERLLKKKIQSWI